MKSKVSKVRRDSQVLGSLPGFLENFKKNALNQANKTTIQTDSSPVYNSEWFDQHKRKHFDESLFMNRKNVHRVK